MTNRVSPRDLRKAFAKVKETLATLDKAQRVSAQDMLLTIGPTHAAIRAGENCPLCERARRKLPRRRGEPATTERKLKRIESLMEKQGRLVNEYQLLPHKDSFSGWALLDKIEAFKRELEYLERGRD